jgi:branched-chain amino acid transport system ATP-binding protein
VLEASALCKQFGSLTVIDHVDFRLGADEAVGIVGPNGAGKTTLLNLLSGAMQPSAGQISYRDTDIKDHDAAARCRLGIGRSHQVPRPFTGMTVFENVLVAAQQGGNAHGPDAYQRGVDALQACCMLDRANRRAETLGLLDRKRLELARALATKPDILLLDEIGGGLTDGEAEELVQIIQQLRKRGIAIVWIEHIVHILVQVVDRLICLDAGRIIADGLPAAVLADQAVMSAYLGGGAI